ncbi:MAG: acyl-CoA dehydrogenase family protein [Actinomycetota bacterium]
MDFVETEEQQLLRSTVARIASSFGHSYFEREARSGGRATELWGALSEAGFTGVNIPEPFGGGMGITELAMVAEETAAAGCPLLMFLVSPAICGEVLARFGSEEQQQRWLPGLGSGSSKMAFAITEPNAGSNSHQMETVAKRTQDGWSISGTKYYISGVDESENLLLVTKTGTDPQTGRGQLTLFVVPTDSSGLTMEPIPVEIVATEKQFTLYFDEVQLSDDHRIGPEGGALRPLFMGLNPERILSAAVLCGLGRYAIDKAALYAKERNVWGVPIGAHQGLAHPLAKAKIDLEMARLMLAKAAWEFDQDLDAAESSNMAKLASADAALQAIDQAMQTHGGNGMSTEFGLATVWGMARLLKVAPVSREMILNYIAIHTLGLPRSY